jgi:hypothetical protein
MLSRYFVYWPRDGRASFLAALKVSAAIVVPATLALSCAQSTEQPTPLCQRSRYWGRERLLRRDLARSKIVDDRRR